MGEGFKNLLLLYKGPMYMGVCMGVLYLNPNGLIWMKFGTEVVLDGRKVLGRVSTLYPRSLEGQCLAISTYFSHLTKLTFQRSLKPHLNHPGQCRVTLASFKYKGTILLFVPLKTVENSGQNYKHSWAVVVATIPEHLLLIPDVCKSNFMVNIFTVN